MSSKMSNYLAAFALVANEYEKTGDAIQGLTPLFAPIVSASAGRIFEPAAFAKDFSEQYGLSMSGSVARALTDRMLGAGLLEKSQIDGTIRCVGTSPDELAGLYRDLPSFVRALADAEDGIPTGWEREFREDLQDIGALLVADLRRSGGAQIREVAARF